MSGCNVLAYIAEPDAPHLLHRRYFPSKIGGFPAWMTLTEDISQDLANRLRCTAGCVNQPLTFILQVYAPRRATPETFHRTVYLFGCHGCSNCFVALRTQLPLKNDFYPPQPASSENCSTEDDFLSSFCCHLCGIPSLEGQDSANAPSQIVDLDEESDKLSPGASSIFGVEHYRCKRAAEWGGLIPTIFHEGELEIFDEIEENEAGANESNDDVEALMQKYVDKEKDNPSEILDKSEEKAFSEINRERIQNDPQAKQLLDLLRRFPRHVLRYYPSDEGNAANVSHVDKKRDLRQPIWFGEESALLDPEALRTAVGNCSSCGAMRDLEFQVHPTLISELRSDRFSFGVLAVYTCTNPICVDPTGYTTECVIKQQEPFNKQSHVLEDVAEDD